MKKETKKDAANWLLDYCKKNGIDIEVNGNNLTVGGSLNLEGTAITSLPDNLTVGGYLYLRNTAITSLPDNLTVGGSLYLEGTAITPREVKKTTTNFLKFKNNKYCLADGIFTEIINKRGNVYEIRNIGKKINGWLVTDGKFTHAHGETLKKAKEDLRFKAISEQLKKDPIKADTQITIQYYRIVTGACEQGIKSWMQQNNITKESYKAKDLLPLLEKTNAYGLGRFKSLITF